MLSGWGCCFEAVLGPPEVGPSCHSYCPACPLYRRSDQPPDQLVSDMHWPTLPTLKGGKHTKYTAENNLVGNPALYVGLGSGQARTLTSGVRRPLAVRRPAAAQATGCS